MPQNKPIEQAGEAALREVRAHGLCGRVDSPPDWSKALDGARAGDPIFVKDPDDSRDDFYLVPLIPANPASRRGAWIMLDPVTLTLREASLLDNWKALAFPDENSGDAEKASEQTHTLPDGTVAKFSKEDFTPNTSNLVWKASAATILPYWPVKELIAPHPVTGLPVSIYVTQEGKVYSQLLPDEEQLQQQPSSPAQKPRENPYLTKPKVSASGIPKWVGMMLGATSLVLLASTCYFALFRSHDDKPLNDDQPLRREISQLKDELRDKDQIIKRQGKNLTDQQRRIEELTRKISDESGLGDRYRRKLNELESIIKDRNKQVKIRDAKIAELEERLLRSLRENKELQKNLNTQKVKEQAHRAEIARLRKQIEASGRTYRELSQKYQNLLKEYNRAKKGSGGKPASNKITSDRQRIQRELTQLYAQLKNPPKDFDRKAALLKIAELRLQLKKIEQQPNP